MEAMPGNICRFTKNYTKDIIRKGCLSVPSNNLSNGGKKLPILR
jgi:hypothetical protein